MIDKKEFVRYLRSNQTDTEKHLWQLLRNRHFARYKFRRQHKIGHYIVDFVCLKQKLIIELDGSQHLEKSIYDKQRSAYLESLGFRILRFWNDEVLTHKTNVLNSILQTLSASPALRAPSPTDSTKFI